jgi:hypothetical protein
MDDVGLTALILIHKADLCITASTQASNQGFRDLWAAKAALLIGAVKKILGGEE